MPLRSFNVFGGQPGDKVWFHTEDVVFAQVYRDTYANGGRPEGSPTYTAVTLHRGGRDFSVTISDPPEAIFNAGPE